MQKKTKVDGRSKAAREAKVAKQYESNMKQHDDGSFTGQTGKTYVAMDTMLHHPAGERQVGGSHYKELEVEPWDAMQAWMSPEAFAGFLRGNALKYLARCDKKGGLEDIKKAQHYMDKLIEVLS